MADNNELMIKIDNVVKQYKLGEIGGTTLRDELQRLGARIKHKEDPTKKIGAKDYNKGEIFRALNGVSFEVKKGERVGIIGHNGAGKSTLPNPVTPIITAFRYAVFGFGFFQFALLFAFMDSQHRDILHWLVAVQ